MIKTFKNRLLVMSLMFIVGILANAADYVQPNVTINPASGSTVSSLDKVEFTYTDTSMVMFTDYTTNYATITKDGESYGTYTLKDAKGVNNQIYIEPNITEPGEYTVTIRAGLVQAALTGTLYDAVSATYTVEKTPITIYYNYEVSPSAAQQVNNLSTIKGRIYATDAEGTELNDITYTASSEKLPALYYIAEGGESVLSEGSVTVDENVKGGFIWTSKNGVTQDGTYKFIIPSGYMTMTSVDGVTISNEQIEIVYTYKNDSGVYSLIGDAENVDIYSIDGKLVKHNANTNDIENLKVGIYIIKGNKIVVNKY